MSIASSSPSMASQSDKMRGSSSSLATSSTSSASSLGIRWRRRPRNNLRVLKALADANVAPDLRYENMPRQSFCVTMDNCLHTIKLGPGHEGRNAVLVGWFDTIKFHDEVVIKVEEAMDVVDEKNKVFVEKQRIYENHRLAWANLNEDPDEFILYVNKWKPEFTAIPDLKRHLRHLPDLARERMERDHARYLEVQEKYEKLIPFEDTYKALKHEYDQAAQELDLAKEAFRKVSQQEKTVAEDVTEDHVVADELGKKLYDVFPTLRTGYLVAKINGVNVEDQPYDVVMDVLQTAVMPQDLEFRRHDYRLNLSTNEWESFQDLRATGRYAPDPRFERCEFVESCRQGDMSYVRKSLVCGAHPDSIDFTGCTGMHHAAAQGHIDMMKMLVANGANIDARNKNLETPLLMATRKGCIKSILWLSENKANMNALDRQRRAPLIHAIRTESLEVVSYFIEKGAMVNGGDFQWSWTSLHYAASVGNLDIVRLLMERKTNKYKLTKTGLTAEEVANQCHRPEVASFLKELVFQDPAQKMLWNDEGLQVWVGSKQAAHPGFATQLGLDCFLVLNDHGVKDNGTQWLERDAALGNVDYYTATFKVIDDDRSDRSFSELLLRLRAMMDFMSDCIDRNRKVLLCCDDGVSTSPSLLLAFLLLKRRYRLNTVLEHMKTIRRQVKPSPSMWKGLQVLEDGLDKKKLRRLTFRVHHSELLDIPVQV